ncbi:MAG: kelch repeat-containing protein, partial [Oscillospiraceae bacterium]|nr:kelch repeat-containing protein [Oscillospiraceae bacterium]
MSKINRTVAFLLSAAFMFNSVNYDVVVKAITENVQEYMEEKKAEEQQKEDDETKEVTTSAVTTSVLTTEVTETTETSETSEEITTVVTDIPKESDTTVTTAVSDTTPAVTSENKTINSTEIYSDDTSDVDFKTELNGDQEIDSIDENTRINGNATIKSGSDINIKQKTVVEIKGNLTIEPDAHLNVSESEIRIIVRGNLIINGQLKCSNSPVLLEGDLIDNEENINEGNGTIVLIGEKQQIIDTNRQIYRLVNRNKSDKPLVFINSLNFENYIDNGNGIISYEKDENGNYTTNPVPVKISNKITLFGSETGLSELIVHNGLCIENGDVGITNDNQKNVTLRIKGDYTQTGGTLKTFGQRMIVEGNYIQSGGTYELIDQHAKLSVLGNMTLKDNSVFKMNQADTRVIVNGDFTVSSNGVNDFKNGVLEIKGDFTQQGNADNLRFSDSGHKVILNGDGRQSVFFGTPTRINPDKSVISRGAQFDTLEITKPFYEYDFKNDLSRERVYENLIQPYDEFYKNTDNKPYRIRRSLNAPVSHLELVDAGGDIYAIGGADVNKKILSDVSRYNFGSNTWQTAGYLNTKRADFAAAAVEDNIYVFGGYDGSRVLNSIELITSKGIENVNLIGDNSLIARKSHEAVYYNGKIYIIGGESADGEILNTVEIFDPVSKTVVVSENSMKTARKNFGASLYFDGNKVYLAAAGGENSSGILKSVEFYDFEKEEWIDKDDLNTPRKGFGLAFIMGKLYAVGGVTADNESGAVYTDTTEGYDGTGWVYLNDGEKNISTSVPRGYFGSAVAYNSLFIAGGETPDVTDVFEQFMPENVRGARFKGNSKGLNGDFTQEKTDLVFNSPVQKLSLDRVYNSQFKDEKSEFLGCGWKFNFESSVKKLSNNKGTVTATYLNVRDNPWGNIIGGLEKGTVFEIDIEGSKKDYNGKTWYKLSGGNWYVSSGYVELVTTDAVEITYPDGIKGYFTKNEEGKYKGNFGTYDSFTFEDSKTCKLTTKDQISYIYTLDGEIFRNTAIKDRYGNQISIKHSSGKVEITDSSGEKITVTKVENKVTATDGRGRTVTYELEGDDLKSVTDTSGLETIYKYNNHSITKITENGNPFCEVEYDKSDRIHKYTDADGNISYNYYEDVYMDENNEVQGIAGNLRRMVVDPSGNETITQYSLSEKRPVSVLDAVNGITSYKYEIKYNGDYVNVTGMKDSDEWYKKTYIKTILKGQYPTSETVKDSNGQETVIEKDERGNVINKTNPDGSYTKYTYDTNCNNVLSEMLYDAGGNVISSIKYSYYNNGALKTVENGSSGSTETYTYDDTLNVKGLIASKVTSRSSSAKITTTYSYDEKGQLISETTGNRTTYYAHSYGPFDKDQKVTLNGKDVIIEKPANDYEKCIFYVQTKLNPEGIFEVSYFDKTLNLVKSTISSGPDAKSTSLYVYDAHGRKIKEVSPEVYANKASEADKLTESCHTYKYSVSGLLSEEIDEEGNTTRYEYDKNGNLAKQTEPGGAVYEFAYDGLNRLTEKKYNDLILEQFSYEKGNSNSTPYKSSKLIHTEYINGDSGLVTETELDYAGRETVSDNPFRKTEKEYYADGNLKRERVFDKSAESKCISDILYFYNDRGMLETTLTGYKPDKSYFISKNIYTLDGLLEYEIVYLDAQEINPDSPKWSENAKANVIRYEYDEHGNVLTESTYTGEISIADVSSAAYVVRTSREYDFPDNTVTEQSGNIKTVYVNNYLGKPVTVKNVVKSSDLIASAAGTGEETELITENTYDRNGNLKGTITPSKSETEYNYDKLGRLTETIQHDVPSDDGSKTGILTETLSYNWAGSVTKKVLKFGDSVKSESEYCYDSRNNLILSADKVGDKYAVTAYEYNRAGLLTAEASPESFAGISSEESLSAETYSIASASGYTKYIYDDAGRLKIKEFVGKTYSFDKESGTMKPAAADSIVISAFEYDANDNLIKEIDGEEYGSDNAKGKTYTYSGTGNVLTERYPESDRDNVIYEYDALGNVKEEKVLKGTSEAVKYAVTNTSYSQVSDTDGITEYTQEISSSYGEDVSSVAPLLSTKTWKTDINGNVIEETLGKKKVQTEYNRLGFESKSVTEVDRNDENESVNSEIKTLYDNEGNAAVIIRSSGIVEINKYDNLRRLISKTTGKRPEGVADNQLSADKLTDSVTLKWTYDIQGNVRFEYDGNGFKTEYRYDELGRLINTIKRYGTDNVSEDRMTYNLDGNLTEETTVLNDIQTGKKTYIYDDLGRVIQKSDFDVPYEFIEYNKNSDQVKSFDAGYVLKEFGYNADRQLTKTILAGVCTEELTYDYAGNVYIKKDGEGNSSFYYYDVMDRLVKVSSAGKNDETPAEIASYTYNTEGNIASKTAGSKNKVTYEYTASDEVKETNSNGKTEKFFYNTDGRLSRSVDPSGNETVYTYNAQGLTTKEEVKADGKVVISKSYTYDKNGNVLKSSVTENGKENVITRTYDELGRVTKKEATDSVTSEFIYDLFTEDNLLCEVTRYDNGESSSNVYDKFGRLKYVYSTDISAGADDSKKTEY